MKSINTSTFNFPDVIANDFLYVDKTRYVWNLVKPKKGEFFLSRPRRFGKSLLVSTLKAIFQGRRELFKGLDIDNEDYDWRKYPVLHFDFANFSAKSAEALGNTLNDALGNIALANHLEVRGIELPDRFANLIKDLTGNGSQVVVLVDEYDKPILSNIDNPNVGEILSLLKGFYGTIKKCEGSIRFAFITGVSKFAHISLFSDLNNLTDITLNAEFAEMLGFSEAEILKYFSERIPLAAKANGISEKKLIEWLLHWYDGYRFSAADTHVCNPVSISKFFNEGYRFSNYWGATGMPTFLFELAKKTRFNFERALSEPVSELAFGAYELDRMPTIGLLWQAGYLTIKDVLPGPFGSSMYRLGFPDMEVEQSFNTQLLEGS